VCLADEWVEKLRVRLNGVFWNGVPGLALADATFGLPAVLFWARWISFIKATHTSIAWLSVRVAFRLVGEKFLKAGLIARPKTIQ